MRYFPSELPRSNGIFRHCPWLRRNLMITLRLFGHETDANHIREEGRHCHLDRRGRLCDWRNDLRPLTMRRLLEPWTPQDDERLKGVRDSRCIGRQSRSRPQTQNRQRPSSRPCARLSLPTAAGGPTEVGGYIGLRLTLRKAPAPTAEMRRLGRTARIDNASRATGTFSSVAALHRIARRTSK